MARTEPTPTAPTATSPTADFAHLAGLIGAGEVDGFLARKLGQDMYRARLDPEARAALFGWDILNRALREHRLVPPRMRLERAGKDVTREAVRERRGRHGRLLHDVDAGALNGALQAGATLIVDNANELSAPLQTLCAGLSSEFLAACQTNMYACWGETPGFDIHWDDHDVFVVQIAGTKRWDLYGVGRPHPVRRGAGGTTQRPAVEPQQIELSPGDVLYLPRGYWHAAVGRGEPTMHLTIGLTRKIGADLLHWMADQALDQTLARTDLPLERDDADLGARIAALLASTLQGADPAELGRLYRRHVETTLIPRPSLSFPRIGLPDETPAGRVWLADGPRRIARRDGACILRHRGVEYVMACELEPALRRLAAGEVVETAAIGATLPPPLRPHLAGLLRTLLSHGVLVAGEA